MAQVNVTINGRQYRMACEDGQEEHLQQLAKGFDDRINELRGQFGEVGDTRLTIMAALTLADALSDASRRLRRLEEDVAALQEARSVAGERSQATQAALVTAFNSAAERIEGLTRRLNQTSPTSGVAMG